MLKCSKIFLKGVVLGMLLTITAPMVVSMEEDLENSKNCNLKKIQVFEAFSQNESEDSGVIDEKAENLARQELTRYREQNREQIDRARKASRFILKQETIKLGGYYQR